MDSLIGMVAFAGLEPLNYVTSGYVPLHHSHPPEESILS